MGNNSFAPFQKRNTSFIVRNIITNSNKTVRIFHYPIPIGTDRDLLNIPGVAEADIRASLLKGEIQRKLLAKEIAIVFSDIDLLQFNEDQRAFINQNTINGEPLKGTTVSPDNFTYLHYTDVELDGVVDDNNTVFTVPIGKFIQDGHYNIVVYKNGVKQALTLDYTVDESGGLGTGFDTVIFNVPPATIPSPDDYITADYYVLG